MCSLCSMEYRNQKVSQLLTLSSHTPLSSVSSVTCFVTGSAFVCTLPSSGETQAYTIGDIGSHRCVVTKLPLTGHSREAAIASGSSTTRLLGTFQGVEHVFIVGVGGGVPHYTDWGRHVSSP